MTAARSRRRLTAALPALLLPAACTLGPDYAPPSVPDGASTAFVSVDPAAEAGAGVADLPDDWWRLYRDPLLDRLLEEALSANTDLAAAEANLAAATSVLEGVRAGQYPTTTVAIGGLYGRDATTDEILGLDKHRSKSTWLFEDVLNASYEIDLFGRVRRSIEASRDDAEAAAAARDTLRVTVAAETTRAYAQICALGREIEVARHSLAVVSHEADITVQRRKTGASSDFDVARAQGLEAQIRADIPPLAGERRAALFELAALLGRTPANAPAAETCVAAPRLVQLIPVGDGTALLKRRPDIRAADRRLAAATARIGVATADLYPRVSLVGLYGGAAATPSDLASGNGLTWGIGPSISWSFPNMAAPIARVHEAKAEAGAALSNFDSIVLTALKETEQSLAAYSAALERRQALDVSQRKAHEAFEQAHDQLAAGSLSYLDLLTTEQALVAADAAVAASDADLIQDQIAIFKALGGGWLSIGSESGQLEHK
jgi:NodT family efflux transporter outer membrane factor (OMF) lipoprotein